MYDRLDYDGYDAAAEYSAPSCPACGKDTHAARYEGDDRSVGYVGGWFLDYNSCEYCDCAFKNVDTKGFSPEPMIEAHTCKFCGEYLFDMEGVRWCLWGIWEASDE